MRKNTFAAVMLLVLGSCSLVDDNKDGVNISYSLRPGVYVHDSLFVAFNPEVSTNGMLQIYDDYIKVTEDGFETLEEEGYMGRLYRYGFAMADSKEEQDWIKSHDKYIAKMKKNSNNLGDFFYLGLNNIQISSNIKIGEYEAGSDISSLFSIHSFGLDIKNVFTYPNCDFAFEEHNYIPKSIEEFCSVSPLFIRPILLSPNFVLSDEEKKQVQFNVIFSVDDELTGARVLQGTSQFAGKHWFDLKDE